MDPNVLPLMSAFGVLAVIMSMLRRRRLKEKYAVLWLLLGGGVAVIAIAPQVLTLAAVLLGVQTPSNLLFFVAALVLLVVSLQLSAEVSLLEEESRTVTEELGLLRLHVEELEREIRQPSAAPARACRAAR